MNIPILPWVYVSRPRNCVKSYRETPLVAFSQAWPAGRPPWFLNQPCVRTSCSVEWDYLFMFQRASCSMCLKTGCTHDPAIFAAGAHTDTDTAHRIILVDTGGTLLHRSWSLHFICWWCAEKTEDSPEAIGNNIFPMNTVQTSDSHHNLSHCPFQCDFHCVCGLQDWTNISSS